MLRTLQNVKNGKYDIEEIPPVISKYRAETVFYLLKQ
jgi:hypothetical protein